MAETTAVEPKGTVQAPYVVRILPSQKTAEGRTQLAEDRAEKRKADLWLIIWTAALAFFTLGVAAATAFLVYTTRLQTRLTLAIESPFPIISAYKLVEYTQIPGETTVRDPVPPGPVPQSCRFLFLLENKGRTNLKLKEVCIEKFSGIDRLARMVPISITNEISAT